MRQQSAVILTRGDSPQWRKARPLSLLNCVCRAQFVSSRSSGVPCGLGGVLGGLVSANRLFLAQGLFPPANRVIKPPGTGECEPRRARKARGSELTSCFHSHWRSSEPARRPGKGRKKAAPRPSQSCFCPAPTPSAGTSAEKASSSPWPGKGLLGDQALSDPRSWPMGLPV